MNLKAGANFNYYLLKNRARWEVRIEKSLKDEISIEIFDLDNENKIIEYKIKQVKLRVNDELRSMIYNKNIK